MEIAVKANVGDDRHTEGVVSVEFLNPAQRTQRALMKLALFWLIAVASVLIPVFHFITVPLFFALGLFFAHRSYRSEGKVLSGVIACPHCRQVANIKPAELQWPVTEICQNCARVLRIEKKLG